MKVLFGLLVLSMLAAASATVYFQETFDKDWEKRWVVSKWKKSDGTAGAWKRTAGEWYGDKEEGQGLQATQDARFYAISAKFDKPFSNEGKDLVFQFQVKFPQKIDCGGGYIKLLPSSVDQQNFGGESDYYIMFGPDICGTTTKRVHVIFNYKGQNHLIKKTINAETDQVSHVYTLIVHPDNTYEVRIDGSKKESGSLFDDWDFLPAKTIKDPNVSKPKDWIDEPLMDDPSDKKPEDYDTIPKQIPDPDAEKPEDWDDESDGKWEAPMIDNPDFKGEWKPKRIANPEFKGKWTHPEIPNPEYVEDNKLYAYDDIGAVGIEIWTVKSGTIFDNIIVADDVSDAEALMESTYGANKAAEKRMFDDAEKQRLDKEETERKKIEEERKKQEANKEDEEEDDEDDEDEDEDEHSHDEL